MFEKIIIPKNDASLWQWEGTKVSHFACHREVLEELICSYKNTFWSTVIKLLICM
ncbi:hypothetical protein HNR63_002402 [Anoxybacillus kamchatkensis]|nr:hypothetical protein [Anoxybacillus ayderensis]